MAYLGRLLEKGEGKGGNWCGVEEGCGRGEEVGRGGTGEL